MSLRVDVFTRLRPHVRSNRAWLSDVARGVIYGSMPLDTPAQHARLARASTADRPRAASGARPGVQARIPANPSTAPP